MADFLTVEQRSERMSRIRSRGNARTELELVRALRALGLKGWRRHVVVRGLEGREEAPLKVRPDFVFRSVRVALFVDGCFWHACPLHGSRPAGNAAFWRRKLRNNAARDRRVNAALKRAGWKVLRIWEHELARKNATALARRLRRALLRPNPSPGALGRPTRQPNSHPVPWESPGPRRGLHRGRNAPLLRGHR